MTLSCLVIRKKHPEHDDQVVDSFRKKFINNITIMFLMHESIIQQNRKEFSTTIQGKDISQCRKGFLFKAVKPSAFKGSKKRCVYK